MEIERKTIQIKPIGSTGLSIVALQFLCLVLISGCTGQNRPEGDSKASWAKVFAPNSISTGNVYRGSFSPDGNTFYFFKKVTEGQEDYRIFVSNKVEGRWSVPNQLFLGGEHTDLYPTISPDGNRMIFSSYRPVPGNDNDQPNANLWFVDKLEKGWGQPQFMAKASTLENYDAKPTFGKNGKVNFETTTPDWSQTTSVFTIWDGTDYQVPEPIQEIEQWRNWRADLHVWGGVLSPQEDFLILEVSTRDESGRPEASDQWISFKNRSDEWTEPVDLGKAINGPGNDNFTFFSHDEKHMMYVEDFERFLEIPLTKVLEDKQPREGGRH